MENNIKNRLMDIKKRTVLVQTVSSYTKTLTDLFVNDLSLFQRVCDDYDLMPEELLGMLDNASYRNVALFDELIQYTYKIMESNNVELKR